MVNNVKGHLDIDDYYEKMDVDDLYFYLINDNNKKDAVEKPTDNDNKKGKKFGLDFI